MGARSATERRIPQTLGGRRNGRRVKRTPLDRGGGAGVRVRGSLCAAGRGGAFVIGAALVWRVVKRHARLYRVFARNNFVRELEFRGNVLAMMVTNVAWLASFTLFLKIFFANTKSVGGWTEGETFLLFGTFLLTRSLMDIFFTPNLSKIPEMIRMGTMDFALTKPVNAQFLVSARYLRLDELGSLLGAFAILTYALRLWGKTPTGGQVGAWLFLVVCGWLVLYAVQLLLMTLSFWLVRLDNLTALTDSVVFIARYPPDIFGKYLTLLFTYLIPLTFIAAVPTRALKDGVSFSLIAQAVAVTVVFFTAATLFFRHATRAYSSASS